MNKPPGLRRPGICRIEGVIDTHIYAPNGIITQGLLTLSAITAQSFLSFWQEIRSCRIGVPGRVEYHCHSVRRARPQVTGGFL
jgi:hypothetical protein